MTAGYDEISSDALKTVKTPLPPDIREIIEYLSLNNKIVFKSQQIDDPELNKNEKIEIAKKLFEHNRQIFLQRFGIYFEEEQLKSFERYLSNATNWTEHESIEEMQDMLIAYQNRLQTRKRDIKNRRYTAMQNLIKEGEYFSEMEMMKRAPELYQELIGQYLSEEEIKKRDSYDVKNTTFTGIFMHQLEQQQKEEILQNAEDNLKKQQESEDTDTAAEQVLEVNNKKQDNKQQHEFEVEVDSDDDDIEMSKQANETSNDEAAYEVPAPCRLQWGNFDNETIACSTSRLKDEKQKTERKLNKKVENIFITAGERKLLRQEFVNIMHQQFLAGEDENFDYTAVDDNTQLDDLTQINQDKEDAYFAASDEEDIIDEGTEHNTKTIADSDSEDELDIYMRHLNQHHSLKN